MLNEGIAVYLFGRLWNVSYLSFEASLWNVACKKGGLRIYDRSILDIYISCVRLSGEEEMGSFITTR